MGPRAYDALLARLVSARRFGVVLGLTRMRALLDRLGAPDARLGTVVHVAGTNGKGSTVAMIAALAAAAGARVATYTSPHLTTLRERIVIDGAMIAEAAFVEAADRVAAAGGDELTFFEQVTAIAMLAIADAAVDVTVLEVGLGGRLDATNVVDAAVAVVTGVALDHQAVLGDTLEAIAREKAGIFKPGQRIVIGAGGEPAAIATLVAAAGAVSTDVAVVTSDDDRAMPTLGLRGVHQRHNARAALAAVAHLAQRGTIAALDSSACAAALVTVRQAGRYEVVEGTPRVILDGAHNPHAAAALAATLATEDVRPLLILAVSADKDVRAIVRAIVPAVDRVIATSYQQERSMSPSALAAILGEVAGPGLEVHQAPDLPAALALARGLGPTTVVVAGSLFLVGEARALLLGAPCDPVWASDPAPTPG